VEYAHVHTDDKDTTMANPKQPPQISEIDDTEERVDGRLVDYDPGGDEAPDDDISFTDLEHGEELTKTENFLGRHHVLHSAETVDQIVDLGVQVLDPNAETHIVRVHTDIGPVFYGGTDQPIELKKNRRYQVPTHIHRYLFERGLLVDQLADSVI
jgi:hypothetical protein